MKKCHDFVLFCLHGDGESAAASNFIMVFEHDTSEQRYIILLINAYMYKHFILIQSDMYTQIRTYIMWANVYNIWSTYFSISVVAQNVSIIPLKDIIYLN